MRWMEEHEYESIRQMQGSMSRRSVGEPGGLRARQLHEGPELVHSPAAGRRQREINNPKEGWTWPTFLLFPLLTLQPGTRSVSLGKGFRLPWRGGWNPAFG